MAAVSSKAWASKTSLLKEQIHAHTLEKAVEQRSLRTRT